MSKTPSRFVLSLAALAAALALSACKNRDESATTAQTNPPAGTSDSATGTVPGSQPPSSTTAGVSPSADNSNAVGTSGTMSANATPLPAPDAQFVAKAAEGGQFEIEIGKLAAQKATDSAVKSFAQMLVDDHSAANDKLRQIATSHNLALPASLPADKQKELDKLAKLSGKAFDKAFVQMVGMKDHKHDIAQFEKASREAKADDLRAFARDALPTLQQHLSTASKLPGHA